MKNDVHLHETHWSMLEHGQRMTGWLTKALQQRTIDVGTIQLLFDESVEYLDYVTQMTDAVNHSSIKGEKRDDLLDISVISRQHGLLVQARIRKLGYNIKEWH